LKPVRVPPVSRTGPIRVERSVKLEPRDDARLDSLEKKLSKVLDELESLKKAKDVKDQQK
jgi:hypothetical protein